MSRIDPKLLYKLNRPAPRYTSYPTAPEWDSLSPSIYADRLNRLAEIDSPLSLYVHIPFCQSMCLYCGCSVVLNRKLENEVRYVDYLIKEIEMIASRLGKRQKVMQLHFGGGTPTKLSIPLFDRLFQKIKTSFAIDQAQEIAIEIDPRTVIEDQGAKLRFLRNVGFNRVSFGVQDTNPKVQEAVKRRQSLEMTRKTYRLARELGFKGVNIDLIYGLPFQTKESFSETVSHILEMRPDRIAFFSYAKVPWLKPHQKAIKDKTLPSAEEKFEIYADARERFVQNGYVAIGMDHFALENDEIATCFRNKTLQRNFQGYSVKLAEEMLSFGVTSIGFVQNVYVQNLKDLPAYYSALDQDVLPVHRGKILSLEDLLRKWVIHTFMCNFELDKDLFHERFHCSFDAHFLDAKKELDQYEANGLLMNTPSKLVATPLGELFIRNLASSFDAYLNPFSKHQKFSQTI